MDNRLKQELSFIISERVIDIFKSMFGVEVALVDDSMSNFDDDDLVSKISMHQDSIDIVLRFAFKRELLIPLLQKIYDSIIASHESTMEDAVCEITNIVCGGLKQHMNENGYNLTMEIPTIDCGFQKYDEDCEECLNINFILDNVDFFIDLKLENTEKEKGTEL